MTASLEVALEDEQYKDCLGSITFTEFLLLYILLEQAHGNA